MGYSFLQLRMTDDMKIRCYEFFLWRKRASTKTCRIVRIIGIIKKMVSDFNG